MPLLARNADEFRAVVAADCFGLLPSLCLEHEDCVDDDGWHFGFAGDGLYNGEFGEVVDDVAQISAPTERALRQGPTDTHMKKLQRRCAVRAGRVAAASYLLRGGAGSANSSAGQLELLR